METLSSETEEREQSWQEMLLPVGASRPELVQPMSFTPSWHLSEPGCRCFVGKPRAALVRQVPACRSSITTFLGLLPPPHAPMSPLPVIPAFMGCGWAREGSHCTGETPRDGSKCQFHSPEAATARMGTKVQDLPCGLQQVPGHVLCERQTHGELTSSAVRGPWFGCTYEKR